MKWFGKLLGRNPRQENRQESFPDPRLIEFIKADSVLARIAPDGWPHDEINEDNAAFLAQEGDILTEDFCRLGEFNFIRCTLPLPIASIDHTYEIGVWATLNKDCFQSYLDTFDDGNQGQLDACISWLGNKILPDAPLPIEGSLVFFDGRVRPYFYVYDDDHPIANMQDNGISFEQLSEIYHYAGRDITSFLRGN